MATVTVYRERDVRRQRAGRRRTRLPGATLGAAVALLGETVSAAGRDVDAWLTATGLA